MYQKCNSCHERGQNMAHGNTYNADFGMCAVCHTPDQVDGSGWTASIRAWVHGIHAASKRTIPYTVHGDTPVALANFTGAVPPATTYNGMVYDGFFNIGFPNFVPQTEATVTVSDCSSCHLPGTFDFSASQYTANGGDLINRMLDVGDVVNSSGKTSWTGFSWLSPNVPDATTGQLVDTGMPAYGLVPGADYGTAPGVDTSTTAGTITEDATAGKNLVSSPITASCSSCHDNQQEINHMKTMGGLFYQPRSNWLANGNTESCLACHGPGTAFAIATVHGQ
jgi:OmcA/MtrC family decaheme c-type cytochrome